MIDNPFVSVIIPVYKVERYLRKCIDSVINQHLEDAELILVDDGSPDNCPAICDEYSKSYPWIRVIHKENGGSSSARNAGIKAARGKYLMFMDSDDWWNENVDFHQVLQQVKETEETEMFVFPSIDYYKGKGYYKRKEYNSFSSIPTDSVESYYTAMLERGNLEVHAATKILKATFVKNNRLFFTDGIVNGEDGEWMLRLLRVVKKIQIIDTPIYCYRAAREGSITNTIEVKSIIDMLSVVERSIDHYMSPTVDQSVMKNEFCYCAYLWFCALGLSTKLPRKERAQLLNLFERTSAVCKYSNSPKTKICNSVYHLVGINATSLILGLYIWLKDFLILNKSKQAG